jgi:acyl-CoA thioester hydrolase
MTDLPAELADFPIVVPWPVAWGDQDSYAHVNNTVYFRWIETARVKYLERIEPATAVPGAGVEPILAAIACNYRRQVKYPDTVQIAIRVTRIGRSSITMEHKLWSEAQRAVVADGQATVVAFDYTTNRSCPVPADMRAAIVRLEGRPVAGAD